MTAWAAEIDAFTVWLAASGSPPSTLRLRRWQVRHLAETYPDRSPWSLSTDDLTRYLAGHRWRPETLKSARGSVRSFYGWAVATGRIPASPAAVLRPVHVPDALPRPAGDATVADALDRADDKTRLMILLGALAGLRAGEIARLAWSDVEHGDLDHKLSTGCGRGVIHVHSKGGKVRVVPLHPELDNALSTERERRRSGRAGSGFRYNASSTTWVFPSQRAGRPVTAGHVSKTLGRVLGDASGHQLRHRFATRVYAAGSDLLAVQQLLGHASVTTTVRYTMLQTGALQRAVLAA